MLASTNISIDLYGSGTQHGNRLASEITDFEKARCLSIDVNGKQTVVQQQRRPLVRDESKEQSLVWGCLQASKPVISNIRQDF